jgi:hypothetical protein
MIIIELSRRGPIAYRHNGHGPALTQEGSPEATPPKRPKQFPFLFSFPSNRDTKTIKNDLQLEENNRHEPFLIETILQGRLQARFAGFTAH